MNIRMIARNGNVNNIPATLGDIVYDRRTRQLYLEVVTTNRTYKMGLNLLDMDLVEPPRQEGA